VRTILFDWDGTIVDSIQALFETDGAIWSVQTSRAIPTRATS